MQLQALAFYWMHLNYSPQIIEKKGGESKISHQVVFMIEEMFNFGFSELKYIHQQVIFVWRNVEAQQCSQVRRGCLKEM